MSQFATFRLNDQLFGVNVLLVREINQQTDFTIVQHAPDYVRGLINLRGHIVTILDLGIHMGLGPREVSPSSHNIILKNNEELSRIQLDDDIEALETSADTAGLLVDTVGDVVTVDDREIEPPPASIGEISGQFLTGVVKLRNDLLVLLDVASMLTSELQESAR
jgi:purine-binding chemotaxis protein CheW